MAEDGFRVHDTDAPDETYGEPEGGWVSAGPKQTAELQAVVLCRYYGTKMAIGGSCDTRAAQMHPDVDCATFFISGKAFEEKTLDLTPILSWQRGDISDAPFPTEVRAEPGGEASGVID